MRRQDKLLCLLVRIPQLLGEKLATVSPHLHIPLYKCTFPAPVYTLIKVHRFPTPAYTFIQVHIPRTCIYFDTRAPFPHTCIYLYTSAHSPHLYILWYKCTVSPHLHIRSYKCTFLAPVYTLIQVYRFPTPVYTLIQMQCCLPIRQLYADFKDFNNGACHVTKITTAEINPDMGLLTQTTSCFSPNRSG